jgi:endonuclease III
MKPMLHRFKENVPRWIVSCARRLQAEYHGDAAEIWPPGAHVLDVVARLDAFDGIGRKKAVMTAELLARHFRVPLEGRDSGQVAFDVHVRRVFLRSGLAEQDSREAIEASARRWSPDAPGLLDLPAWLIGRETCRPNVPQCDACRLAGVCARRVWIRPQGVGERRATSAKVV